MYSTNNIIATFEEILDLEQVLQEALEHNEAAGTHYATMNKIIINKITNLLNEIEEVTQLK